MRCISVIWTEEDLWSASLRPDSEQVACCSGQKERHACDHLL